MSAAVFVRPWKYLAMPGLLRGTPAHASFLLQMMLFMTLLRGIELGFKHKITDYAGFSTCVHSLLARYSDTPSLREAYSFKHCVGYFVCAPVDRAKGDLAVLAMSTAPP